MTTEGILVIWIYLCTVGILIAMGLLTNKIIDEIRKHKP